MPLTAEPEYTHIGETAGCPDHDYDMVHEFSRRLGSLWRMDQYIANAEGHTAVQKFWRELKDQETNNVKRLKDLLKSEFAREEF